MIIRVGVENNMDGHSLAWALDFPGCFADGSDASTCLIRLPQRLLAYENWVSSHTGQPWFILGDFDIRMEEAWDGYFIDNDAEITGSTESIEINAWFRDDWRPLKVEEISRGLQLLSWTRSDLLTLLADLSEEVLDKTYPGERWGIRGILRHVANAEWWYLSRLGLTGGQDWPKDTQERLQRARACMETSLPTLMGAKTVLGIEGEFWSPRKLLRRILWHERDHTGHIARLLAEG